MTRDNNTLIFEAVGTTYTPAEIHALAATLATPEQITARAAAMAAATGTGTAADYIDTAEQATVADSLHTYNTWKAQGLQVKRGQKATISAMLWRWTDKPPKAQRSDNGDDAPDPHYYMKRCYLFTAAQVERPAPVHVKTPDEIAARNAELAAARKARKAAQQAAATAPAPQEEFLNWDPAEVKAELDRRNAENDHVFVDRVMADVERITATTPSKHDDAPTPEPVQLDFATLAAQVLA